ncbi:MAG: hypothetical protein H0Z28_05560 [Archaeoglobus sp.]|nr:hypothetical protein [Archaeoglobus sp.]
MERIICIFVLAIVVLFTGCSEKVSKADVQPNSPLQTPSNNQNSTSIPFHNNTMLTPSPLPLSPQSQRPQPTEPPQPPQPPLPHISRWEVELTGEEREETINLVLNDTKVKEWLGEGYDIINVTRSDDTAWVYILTQKQIPPWIVGITLMVPVDLKNKRAEGEAINFR